LSVKAIVGYNIRSVGENEFNSVVCLVRHVPDISWQSIMFCTGTFISPTHILSAEHCSREMGQVPTQVVLKSNNLEQSMRYSPIWWITYDYWMVNQARRSSTSSNDILIIKVKYLYHNLNCIIIRVCIDKQNVDKIIS
jgi:secreted trypsin-like serine protease